MATDISKVAFDALYDQSGLTLTPAQKATLHKVYPMLRAMIDRVSAPMPREVEPALTFRPEVK